MIRSRLRNPFIPKHGFILHVRRNSSLASLSFTPSKEQLEIVEACKTHNCIISARPGSGKTSTAEVLVHENRDKKTLILTYSKRLQLSTSDKLSGYGSSVDVATFHR
jgi:superfamily II DNA or RNA helicase